MHRTRRTLAGASALALGVALMPPLFTAASAAPVGQGFNVTPRDLGFILKQIKIAEQHAASPLRTASDPCGGLVGDGPDQIPGVGQGVELPWGLRTVDGSCNNLLPDQEYFGAGGKPFPRLVPKVLADAEAGEADGPFGPTPPTTYKPPAGTQKTSPSSIVIDSQPRVISNLIVDQTASNPAAVEAAGEDPEVAPSGTLSIPNTAPDVGLSAPYNSWFTLFGQFFDHGLDLTSKGGSGTVFVPLNKDDPLYVEGSPTNFMVLTRATTDVNGEAVNQTSSFVDQSQTYSSHPSHQVFLREYAKDANDDPQATGDLLTGPRDGMANWTTVKTQAAEMLGIALSDRDALSVPLLATDPYGKFTRGPNGYPQIVLTDGTLREGDPASPVTTAGAVPTGTAFLDDIAHHAGPGPADTDNNPRTPREFPTPDSSGTPAANGDATPDDTSDDGNPATYDDEMLGAHFIAGDGRLNENIGLTAVHNVFHSEHNRLLDETDDDPSDLKTVIKSYVATNPTNPQFTLQDWQRPDGEWDGERLFQAARFVTEMQYQHLAFEEFARKVQPLVNLFGEGGVGYNTSINPSIRGEFANAVYRFGHSMLTETVDRVSAGPNAQRSDLPLLDAFLNPPAFMPGSKTPEQATGDIVRGMTRQVGNEIDEFVTEALRNELLGLPLDLPTLNMARARETGTATLNAARRAFYESSNNTALAPYESWADFNFALRNKASLANFIAAYGTHGSVTGQTTLAGKRNAGNALVYGAPGKDNVLLDDPATAVDEAKDNPTGPIPADRVAFLNSTGAYVSGADGVTTTGVDRIDLWMGGLAEKQTVFGGLLGPTFNFVFEKQMEDLQNGDRLYYLSRTVGLNMLTQLEGNSFAELIQRNSDVSGLPADSFSRPDYVFDLAAQNVPGAIVDDPDTVEYDERDLLVRTANGTVRYGGPAHVVFNGTASNDKVWSSEGDDTIRGNDGDDRIEGGDGVDQLIGGLGDDILTDLAGDDTLKGGDGDDVLSSGQGFGGDLNQGGRGNDFILGGNDITESFAGDGDDFVFAGDADDTVFGDEGEDWIEGGTGNFNLLQGDNGAPFQDDPTGGADILIGYGGEQDYDAEGGDDIMLAGPGLQRAEGMLGFDWFTHVRDTAVAPDSDMRFTGLLPPGVETNRDRMDLVESLSGWNRNDVLRGNDADAAAMVGHELNAEGVARIGGLSALLGGATSFTGGNILIGGAGSDLIEGRGGDDVIDGDAYLNVRISVRDAANPNVQIDSVDTMAGVQARVLAGTVKPGQLRPVRDIVVPDNGSAVDTALFSGPLANYAIATNATTGVTTVTQTGANAVGQAVTDGVDRLRRVENLRFTNVAANGTVTFTNVALKVPNAPTNVVATTAATSGTVNVTWTAPSSVNESPRTSYQIVATPTTGPTVTRIGVAANATSSSVTGLVNGMTYTVQVRAVNQFGLGPLSAASNPVVPAGPPGAPTALVATRGNGQVALSWTAPVNNGGSPITGYTVQVRQGAAVLRTETVTGTSTVITGLTNGTAYTFRIAAVNARGTSATLNSAAITPATVPDTPVLGAVTSGAAGGARTVNVNWTPVPVANNGGTVVTGYSVSAYNTAGDVALRVTVNGANASTRVMQLGANQAASAGPFTFDVRAINAVGSSGFSARSAPTLAQ